MRWWVAPVVLLGVGTLLVFGSVAYEVAVDGFPFPPQDINLVTSEQWRELYPPNAEAAVMRLVGALLFAAGLLAGCLAWLRGRGRGKA